jgi:hypothetical protein
LKFGQTTIARQDVNKSISEEQSQEFKQVIENVVSKVDPDESYFRIEDTGKDLEIILTIGDQQQNEGLKDFDKGDGIDFLDSELNLNLENGGNLICGDTASDIRLVETAMEKSQDTVSVFVTKDHDLQKQVLDLCPNTIFVSTPDILVMILNNLSNY